MRKFFTLTLVLVLLLVSCGETEPPVTTEVPEITAAPETTSIPETTAVPETTVVTEPPAPIMQVAFEEADKIEKQAKDHFNGGDFDFKHSIVYTRLLSDAPGAVALNEKIRLLYAPLAEKLRSDKEANELYRIGYNAAYTGKDYHTLMFHYTEFGGWQYSEGGTTQRFFYYDGLNDRELTVDEYLASMDVDKEAALAGALWSHDLARAGYTADYDGEMSDHGADTEYRLPDTDALLGATAENQLYYQRFTKFADSVKLDGAYVEPDTVTLYFSGCMYTTNTFTVTLDRETLEPIRPNYEAVVALTAADTDRIELLFANGKVTSATAPAAFADARITVKAHKLCVPYFAELNDALLSVNGDVPKRWSSAGNTLDFYYDGYAEYDELKSIVLYISPADAPPIENARSYTRDAFNIYSGGVIGKQLVTYPRVTTGTAAAEAFNAKVADRYDPIIQNLTDGEDRRIYDISYSFTYTDGVVAFAVDSVVGVQGTEGGNGRDMFYFDVESDRELTMEEYAAHMGVDMDKTLDGALWSYDLGSAGYGTGDLLQSETLGGKTVAPAANAFYYGKFVGMDASVTVDGIGVGENEVVLYLSGHAYVSDIFTVTLDRTSLLPIRPNYCMNIDVATATEGDFLLTFAEGRLVSAALPDGVHNVRISASGIGFDAEMGFKTDSFSVNGGKWGLGYHASYDPDTKGYSYYFYLDPYIPIEKLNSITIEER